MRWMLPPGDAADREPSRPDALILCYPVINVTEEFGHRGSGKNLLGEKFGTPEALRFNLETRVTAETPPGVSLAHRRRQRGECGKQSAFCGGALEERCDRRAARIPAWTPWTRSGAGGPRRRGLAGTRRAFSAGQLRLRLRLLIKSTGDFEGGSDVFRSGISDFSAARGPAGALGKSQDENRF